MTMKSTVLTIIVALFATNAFAVEIPQRAQKKILDAAPELDLNSDGSITADELITGRDKLPVDMRAMLDAFLNFQGDATKGAEPTKPKTTLPKPPVRDGATPFIVPLFEFKSVANITTVDSSVESPMRMTSCFSSSSAN